MLRSFNRLGYGPILGAEGGQVKPLNGSTTWATLSAWSRVSTADSIDKGSGNQATRVAGCSCRHVPTWPAAFMLLEVQIDVIDLVKLLSMGPVGPLDMPVELG